MTAGIDYAAVERAVHDWVAGGTGVPGARVVKADEGPRPEGFDAYVEFRVSEEESSGMDWTDIRDADAPAPGAEIVHYAQGPRTATVSLQCFVGEPAKGVGNTAPGALLSNLVSRRRLPSQRAIFEGAGVGLLKFGKVLRMDGKRSAGQLFEPRAVLEFTVALASEASESTTYIEHATIKVNDDPVHEVPPEV